MLNRWVEQDLLGTLDELGVGCIAFSPLAHNQNRWLPGSDGPTMFARCHRLPPCHCYQTTGVPDLEIMRGPVPKNAAYLIYDLL